MGADFRDVGAAPSLSTSFFSLQRKAVNSADDEVVLIGKDKVGSTKAKPVLDEIGSQEAAPSPVWSPPPT